MQLEELEKEEQAEILCMTFLEPYPVLVCGDSSGVLWFFSVRPSLYKNQLLLSVNVLSAVASTGVSFTKVGSIYFLYLFSRINLLLLLSF
jgi:hypothetical protein